MKETLIRITNNIFTARDNHTVSLTKLVGVAAAGAMIYKFVTLEGPVSFSEFGTGISLLMAALAVKYAVERD